MKRTKRIFAMLFAVVFLLSAMPLQVFAVETPPVVIKPGGGGSGGNTPSVPETNTITVSGIHYDLNRDENTATVTGFDGSLAEMTIPEIVFDGTNSFSVVAISDSAFEGATSITSVDLPSSLESIGTDAFSGCSSLTTVEGGEHVSFIGRSAFQGTAWLLNEDLSELVVLGRVVYAYKGTPEKVIIDSEIVYVAEGAFADLSDFSVVFNSASTTLHEDAFLRCANVIFFAGASSEAEDYASSAGFDFYLIPSLTWVKLPTKQNYLEGETLELDDGLVCYVDEANAGDLTILSLNECVITGYDPTLCEEQTVTATYNGLSLQFNVAVRAKVVTRVEIVSFPKTEYKVGQSLDFSGAMLRLIYEDDENDFEDIPISEEMITHNFNSAVPGTYTFTVTFDEGLSDFVTLTVTEKAVSSVSVTTPPTLLTVKEGMTLNLDGGKITVYYDDGSDEELPMTEEMIELFDSNLVGEQQITIIYEGVEAVEKLTVTVLAKLVTEISIKSLPDKLLYTTEEELNLSGAWITISYDNDTVKDVRVTTAMVSGFDRNTLGEQTLTITYEGKTVSFTVTVEEYVKDDLNGDRVRDDKDALHLLYHLFKANNYPLSTNGDLNGDGIISDRDVVYFLKGEENGGGTLVPGGGGDAPPVGGLPINDEPGGNTTPIIPNPENTPALSIDVTHSSVSIGGSATATVSLSGVSAFTSAFVEIRVGDKLRLVSGQWLTNCLLGDFDMANSYGAMVFENASLAGEIFTFSLKGLEITDGAEISVTVTLHNAQANVVATLTATATLAVTEAPAAILGDFDGNEKVDIDDAIYLLRHSMFPGIYPIEGQDVDYNNDNTINIDDAIYLLRHSMFPSYYPLT